MVDEQVREALGQNDSGVRFEWGPTGCRELSVPSGCVAVVDVLSFTTAVTVATRRGISILPLPLNAANAQEFASAHQAQLAVRRREVSPEHPWSLSPASLAEGPYTKRLVLPSPNGAVISLLAAGVVVAACIRNAAAVGRWIVEEGYGTRAHPVLVLAAGERWADESLRPAVEDAIGAGAVLEYLRQADLPLSAEASVIANLYRSIVDLDEAVRACASARELQAIGYGRDVDDAVALDVDGHVPVLRDGAFTIA